MLFLTRNALKPRDVENIDDQRQVGTKFLNTTVRKLHTYPARVDRLPPFSCPIPCQPDIPVGNCWVMQAISSRMWNPSGPLEGMTYSVQVHPALGASGFLKCLGFLDHVNHNGTYQFVDFWDQ